VSSKILSSSYQGEGKGPGKIVYPRAHAVLASFLAGRGIVTVTHPPRDPFFHAPVAAEGVGKCVTPLLSPFSSPPDKNESAPKKSHQNFEVEIQKGDPGKKIAPEIAQKNSELKPGSFFLILDEKLMQYFRRPRSKKRRIRRKWRARPENYRPHPLVFEQRLVMGRLARLAAIEGQLAPSYQYPVLKMHPETWERLVASSPGLREQAIIRVEVVWRGPTVNFTTKRKKGASK
jgi:hypothetical protein